MAKKTPVRSIQERILDAETRCGQWLADGNMAETPERAAFCYEKSQYWLDRANYLSGRTDRQPPKQ